MGEDEIQYVSAKKVAQRREYEEATGQAEGVEYRKASSIAKQKEKGMGFKDWAINKGSKLAGDLKSRVEQSQAYSEHKRKEFGVKGRRRGGVGVGNFGASPTAIFTSNPFGGGGLSAQDPSQMGDPMGGGKREKGRYQNPFDMGDPFGSPTRSVRHVKRGRSGGNQTVRVIIQGAGGGKHARKRKMRRLRGGNFDNMGLF